MRLTACLLKWVRCSCPDKCKFIKNPMNIIDLLGDWREVTKKNEDVSKIYILYQVFFAFNINFNAYFHL